MITVIVMNQFGQVKAFHGRWNSIFNPYEVYAKNYENLSESGFLTFLSDRGFSEIKDMQVVVF